MNINTKDAEKGEETYGKQIKQKQNLVKNKKQTKQNKTKRSKKVK